MFCSGIQKIFVIALICFSVLFGHSSLAYDFEGESGLLNSASEMGYKTGTESKQLPAYIGSAISIFLGLLGVIFLGLIFNAGFTWMKARGNEQEVTKAKETISRAIVGIIIVLAAYAITTFFLDNALPKEVGLYLDILKLQDFI